jgi:hypothetical protein
MWLNHFLIQKNVILVRTTPIFQTTGVKQIQDDLFMCTTNFLSNKTWMTSEEYEEFDQPWITNDGEM